MVRNGSILGVNPRGRGIEQMETFGGDARDDFGGHATPGERFAGRQEPAGSGDGGQHSGGFAWVSRAHVGLFHFVTPFCAVPDPPYTILAHLAFANLFLVTARTEGS